MYIFLNLNKKQIVNYNRVESFIIIRGLVWLFVYSYEQRNERPIRSIVVRVILFNSHN